MLGALGGSPAARAGIRYGDVLLSVNGRRTKTVVDYIEAKDLRRDGMEIVVFRSGSETIEELRYEESAAPADPAAIVAELVALRIAPGAASDAAGGAPEDDDDGGSSAGAS